jgi:hypothetical protein
MRAFYRNNVKEILKPARNFDYFREIRPDWPPSLSQNFNSDNRLSGNFQIIVGVGITPQFELFILMSSGFTQTACVHSICMIYISNGNDF